MTELKPCPFCGRVPNTQGCKPYGYFVVCDCGIEQSRIYKQKCDAVKHWNRRKTESNSEIPNNCEDAYPCDTCRHNKLEWYSEVCDSCCGNNNHYEPKDEPQTVVRLKHFKCPKCGRSDYIRSFEDWGIDGGIYKYKCINCNTYIKDEPQTDCAWRRDDG